MERNFQRCLAFVLAREGGATFTNDPNDPGGATKYGITLKTLSGWHHHTVTAQDVSRLSRAEAAAIFHARYWRATYCGEMPSGLDLLIFDAAANMGPRRSLDLLKAQIGMGMLVRKHAFHSHPVDRHLVAGVEAAVLDRLHGQCMPAVIAGLCMRRAAYYRSLPKFAHFGRGWLARVQLAQALAMHMWVTGSTGLP